MDVASRYKEAQTITDKITAQVGKALEFIYLRSPLTWPNLLQIDPGFAVLYKSCGINTALLSTVVLLVCTETRASWKAFIAPSQKGCLATSTTGSWLSLERAIMSGFFVYLR